MSFNFLDTLKGYGTQLQDAAVSGLKNTADITVQAASDVLKNAANDALTKKSASNGVIKQPPKGMDADGSTLLVVPAGTSVNNQGQIVSAPGTIGGMDTQKVMMVGGGIVAAVLLTVIIIKVLK